MSLFGEIGKRGNSQDQSVGRFLIDIEARDNKSHEDASVLSKGSTSDAAACDRLAATPSRTCYHVTSHDREALVAAGLNMETVSRYADAFAMFSPHRGHISEAQIVSFYANSFPRHSGFSTSDFAAMFKELEEGHAVAGTRKILDFKDFARVLRRVEKNITDVCEASSLFLQLGGGSDASMDVTSLRRVFKTLSESISEEEANDMLIYAITIQGIPSPAPRRVTDAAAAGAGFPSAVVGTSVLTGSPPPEVFTNATAAGPPNESLATMPVASTGIGAKPEFKKYNMMQKMHLPRGAIEQKMRAEGRSDAEILDFFD